MTTPEVLKPRSSWVAAWMLPLPETVDWTTPSPTVIVRPVALAVPEEGPTMSTAATIAPTQSAASR